MEKLIERTLLLGLGALTLTRERIKQAVDELVAEGEVEIKESQKLVDKLVAKGEAEREELRGLVRQEVDKVTPVSRKEFEALSQKVDQLAERLERIAGAASSEE